MRSDSGRTHSPAEAARDAKPLRHRLVRGSAYAFVATILGQAFALVTSIVYARLLGPGNLGVFAIYAQLSGLAVAIAGLGLSTPVTRFVARYRTEDPVALGKILSTALVLTLVATSIVAVVSVSLIDSVAIGLYRSPDLALMVRILSLFLVFNSLSNVGASILQGLQRIGRLSLIGIFIEAFTIPVMFVALSWYGLVGAVLGGTLILVCSTLMLFGSAWRDLRRENVRLTLSFDRLSARQVAAYTLPLLGSMALLKVAFLIQTSELAFSLGYGDAGLFRVATTISRIVAFVSGSISVPLLPAISELHATAPIDQNRSKLTTILRISTYAGLPIALGVGLFAGVLIAILFGDEYVAAAPLAFVLVLAGFLDIISVVAANSMLADGRTNMLLALDGLQSVVIVGGTAVLIERIGLLGVGYALLLNSAVHSAMIILLLGKRNRVEVPSVVAALLPAAGVFVLATVSVFLANAQVNLWLAASVVAGSTLLSWGAMAPHERRLIRSVPRVLMGRGVS